MKPLSKIFHKSFFSEARSQEFFILVSASMTLLFLFIALANNVHTNGLWVRADLQVMEKITSLRNHGLSELFLFCTHLGNWPILATFGVAAGTTFWLFGRKQFGPFLFQALVVGQIIYPLFKNLLRRTRPSVDLALIDQSGFSFPSGHATASFLFYGMMAFLLWKIAKEKWLKLSLASGFSLIILSIGFSRIYLGVHWFSDVLGGWLLGGVLLCLHIAFLLKKEGLVLRMTQTPPFSQRTRSISIIFIILLSGIFVLFFHFTHPLNLS